MQQMKPVLAAALCFGVSCSAAMADYPQIEAAEARQIGDRWRIQVTLSHPDTGWDHYADGWEVLDQEGSGLGFRELLHPHEHEQPFTRSLDLVIPEGTTRLYIRARCNVDGLDYTNAFVLELP